MGGGICQVSSTLYLASVYAELTILERVNHGFPVHYIPYGMDATVNWGFTDLKMRNDSPLPVKIRAETSDGCVRIDTLGTEVPGLRHQNDLQRRRPVCKDLSKANMTNRPASFFCGEWPCRIWRMCFKPSPGRG